MGIDADLVCRPRVLSSEREARSGSSSDFFLVRREGWGTPGFCAGDAPLIARLEGLDAFDAELPITHTLLDKATVFLAPYLFTYYLIVSYAHAARAKRIYFANDKFIKYGRSVSFFWGNE